MKEKLVCRAPIDVTCLVPPTAARGVRMLEQWRVDRVKEWILTSKEILVMPWVINVNADEKNVKQCKYSLSPGNLTKFIAMTRHCNKIPLNSAAYCAKL